MSLFFVKPAYDNRDRPGSWSFAVLCVGIGVYGLSAGLDWFVSGYALSHFVFTVRSLGGVLITTAWLLLALSVTDRIPVTRRLGAAFAGYVVATQLLFWTDPLHHLVVAPGSTMDGANFEPEIGVGLWAVLGVGYLATFVGTGILATDALRSTGIRRSQHVVLSLAIVPTLLGSLATVSGVTTYDYTPLGYALTATMFAWALFSGRFLDLTPVARRTALGEMSDAVVTLDDGNRVVDCNRRARELFDAGADYAGQQAADFFPAVMDELDAFDDVVDTETEITIRLDDRERHFSLSVSPVTRRGQRGRVVVLRDISERKRREQDLERQNERLDRFASMVGHDLRNPLTVAAGQLALAEERCESDTVDEHLDAVERSHERMDAMVEDLLTLARSGQRVEEAESVELAMLVREAWTHAEVDGCALALDVPDDVTITADADRLLHVFENCFRNAAEHGRSRDGKAVSRDVDRSQSDLSASGNSQISHHDENSQGEFSNHSASNRNASRSDDAAERASTSPRSRAHDDAAEHGSASPDSQARQDAPDHNDGPVTVRVGLLGSTGDGRFGFFIEDDGEGIPAAERDQVFDHGYTTGEAGTGLGLFIVRDIVDAHGWDVRVTEGTDGGARFEVTGVGSNSP